jgi:hypothetical protein
VASFTFQPLYSWCKETAVPIIQEAGWALESVRMLRIRNKTFALARNRTSNPRSSAHNLVAISTKFSRLVIYVAKIKIAILFSSLIYIYIYIYNSSGIPLLMTAFSCSKILNLCKISVPLATRSAILVKQKLSLSP